MIFYFWLGEQLIHQETSLWHLVKSQMALELIHLPGYIADPVESSNTVDL